MKLRFLPILANLLAYSTAFSASDPLIAARGPFGIDPTARGVDPNAGGVPQAVWAGTHGVAVWSAVSGLGSDFPTCKIKAVRFDASGQPMGGSADLFITRSYLQPSAGISLTYLDGELLLAWVNSGQLYARRLRPDLTWIDPVPIFSEAVFTFNSGGKRPIVGASNNRKHALLFETATGLRCARIGPASAPTVELLTLGIPANGGRESFAIAGGLGGFMVLQAGSTADGKLRIEALPLGDSGPATGPRQLVSSTPDTGGKQISLAAFGSGYAAAWSRSEASGESAFLWTWVPLDTAGSPMGTARELFPREAYHPYGIQPVEIFASTNGLVAFSAQLGQPSALGQIRSISRAIAIDGTPGPIAVFGAAGVPNALISTPGGSLAIGGFDQAMLAQSIAPDASPAGPLTLLDRGVPEQQSPAIVCRENDFLVVWQDARDSHLTASDIRGRLFDFNGSPLGGSFLIAATEYDEISPSIACSGNTCLAAWTQRDGRTSDVYGVVISGPDAKVSKAFPIATGTRSEKGVAVGAGPEGGFFAAWRNAAPITIDDFVEDDDIYGAWISQAGVVSPANGFPVANTSGKERAVTVNGGLENYGIVWRTGGGTSSNAYAAILPALPPALPVTPSAITLSSGRNAHAPDISWTGTQYRVAWHDNGTIESILLSSSGEKSTGISLTEMAQQRRVEPGVLAAGGGAAHLLSLDHAPATTQWFRYRLHLASLDASGNLTMKESLAPRNMRGDTLTAAISPDGTIMGVYSPGPDGKEPSRTGQLEMVILHPGLAAPRTTPLLSRAGGMSSLEWAWSPHFPPDAAVFETSADLIKWLPLSAFAPSAVVEINGSSSTLRFPDLPGERRAFRLRASLPGQR